MRGVRVAILLISCALACAKQDGLSKASKAPEAETATVAPADAAGAPRPAMGGAADDGDVRESTVTVVAPASLEDLTASLEELEVELRGEGVRLRTYRKAGAKKDHAPRDKPSTKQVPGAGAPVKDEDPCLRICAIATTVCALRERICLLADEHADEPRYAATCKRAERDCTRATEACDDCG